MASQSEPLNKLAAVLLWLPDGRLALQRRTDDAPIAPGKLGLFGGHLEGGETPEQGARRELAEEISLDTTQLELRFVAEIFISKEEIGYAADRDFSIYEAQIPSDDFKVFEGSGVESYFPDELQGRDDVSLVVVKALEHVKQNQ